MTFFRLHGKQSVNGALMLGHIPNIVLRCSKKLILIEKSKKIICNKTLINFTMNYLLAMERQERKTTFFADMTEKGKGWGRQSRQKSRRDFYNALKPRDSARNKN